MSKHERAIALIDISLDQLTVLLIHTKDEAKRLELLAQTKDLILQRIKLNDMEHAEIISFNAGGF